MEEPEKFKIPIIKKTPEMDIVLLVLRIKEVTDRLLKRLGGKIQKLLKLRQRLLR